MRGPFKILFVLSLAIVLCSSLHFDLPVTSLTPKFEATKISFDNATFSFEETTIDSNGPVTPAFVNDDSSKINNIKEKLKADQTKLKEEFNSKKKEFQDKRKKLNDEAEPLIEKLREVRKVNRDKEEELKVEEITEKSLELRRKFKQLLDKLAALTDSRFDAKHDYRRLRNSCRVKNGRPSAFSDYGSNDYDELSHKFDCSKELSTAVQKIDSVNADISSTLQEMTKKDKEIVIVELELKNAEDTLWTAIQENRESIKNEVERLDEIYGQTAELDNVLKRLGKRYEMDQIKLNTGAKKELLSIAPKNFKWLPWNESKRRVPKNALVGGFDFHSEKLHIIRRESNGNFQYGTFAAKRGEAYICKFGYREVQVYDFDILIGDDFVWCPIGFPNYDVFNDDYPFCKAPNENFNNGSSNLGILSEDGACDVCFGGGFYHTYDNVEKLSIGEC